jgi:hypothetical protein
MSSEKMREEFEAWVLDKWPETDLGQFNDGEYCGFTLQHCWAAWQASRAAAVVELPQQSGGNPDWNQAIRYCRQAIEAAGLQVKP